MTSISTNAVTIAPVQWGRFKHIDNVQPINNEDHQCLSEVREVFRKHGQLNRLGVALLHTHFSVAEDEVMLETSDDDSSLTLKPANKSEIDENSIGTIWSLEGENPRPTTMCQPSLFAPH